MLRTELEARQTWPCPQETHRLGHRANADQIITTRNVKLYSWQEGVLRAHPWLAGEGSGAGDAPAVEKSHRPE